jgi:hypothetical protein
MRLFRTRAVTSRPELTLDARFTIDPLVRVTDATGDGCVILHTATARMWVLNRSAAAIWARLAGGGSLRDAVERGTADTERPTAGVAEDAVRVAHTFVAAGLLHVVRPSS